MFQTLARPLFETPAIPLHGMMADPYFVSDYVNKDFIKQQNTGLRTNMGRLDPDVFSRGDSAWVLTSTGWYEVTGNDPRIGVNGLEIERDLSNLLDYNTDPFDGSSSWSEIAIGSVEKSRVSGGSPIDGEDLITLQDTSMILPEGISQQIPNAQINDSTQYTLVVNISNISGGPRPVLVAVDDASGTKYGISIKQDGTSVQEITDTGYATSDFYGVTTEIINGVTQIFAYLTMTSDAASTTVTYQFYSCAATNGAPWAFNVALTGEVDWAYGLFYPGTFEGVYSPVVSTTIPDTRTREWLKYDHSSLSIPNNDFAVLVEWVPNSDENWGDEQILFQMGVSGANHIRLSHGGSGNFLARKRLTSTNYDSTASLTGIAGRTPIRGAARYQSSGDGVTAFCAGSKSGTPHANTTDCNLGTLFAIGAKQDANDSQMNGGVTKLIITSNPSKLTDAFLQAWTA